MKNDFKKNFGANIKYYRELKGYTQASFAEKIGLAENTISYIERGKNSISFSRIPSIARALEVEPYKLFYNVSEEPDYETIKIINKYLETATNRQLKIIENIVKSVLDL